MLRLMLSRLKNTKAQALLLVIIVSMFSLALVLGIVERTNKQLTIQRQNAEYQVAFSNALGAIAGLKALVDKGDITPGVSTNDQINAALASGSNLLPGINSTDYKINIPQYVATNQVPQPVVPDKGLLVEQFIKEKTNVANIPDVSNVVVSCPTSAAYLSGVNNLAVITQIFYRDTSAGNVVKIDNIATKCFDNGNIDSGADWGTTAPLPSNPSYGISVGSTTIGSTTFKDITYQVPSNRKKILYVKVIPKTEFGIDSSVSVPLMVKLTDGSGSLLGTSTPIQGTAIGYGSNARTSTVFFTISNIKQLPSFFDYVTFEGN